MVRKAPCPTVMADKAAGRTFVEQVCKPGLDASGVASVAGKPDVFAFCPVAFHLIDTVPGVHMLPRVIGQHRCFRTKYLCRNKERHIPVCHIVRDLLIPGEVLIVDGKDMSEAEEDRVCRHWTARRIAEENNVSAATVQKYAIFTRALEEIGKKEPKLVPKILSGQYKIAHKHVMEMAELPAQDLRRINRKIERNPAEFMQYKATRPVVQGGRFETAPGDSQAAPSVKDMPEFDPDAEISSLTLTIPSWQSSIERTKNTADLTSVSPQAKGNLVRALNELSNTIADLLVEMEDNENG